MTASPASRGSRKSRPTRLGTVLTIVALVAAACSGGKGRPVAKPGELAVIIKGTKAEENFQSLVLGADGSLYAADLEHDVVVVYPPGGGHREIRANGAFTGAGTDLEQHMAVAPDGTVYLARKRGRGVIVTPPKGTARIILNQPGDPGAPGPGLSEVDVQALAVDPRSGLLYAAIGAGSSGSDRPGRPSTSPAPARTSPVTAAQP